MNFLLALVSLIAATVGGTVGGYAVSMVWIKFGTPDWWVASMAIISGIYFFGYTFKQCRKFFMF